MADPRIYTIGWICALSTEYVAAQCFLDEEHERPSRVEPHDSNDYTLGRMGVHNVVLAVLPDGEYGLTSAAVVVQNLLSSFPNIKVGLMVGIGGGAPSAMHDIRLGDVVVSSPHNGHGGVFQYDFGKTIQNQAFKHTGFLNQPPASLRTAVSGLKAEFDRKGNGLEGAISAVLAVTPKLQRKYGRPPPETDILYHSHIVFDPRKPFEDDPHAIITRPERTKDDDDPGVHYGLIASSNSLMKDARVRDKLAADKGVLCFEMEAAGIINQFSCLVVRGICDYSDSHKNKTWQGYAAMSAAAYAKSLVCRIQQKRLEGERTVTELVGRIHSTVSVIGNRLERSLLEKLPSAKGASYNAYYNERIPRCLPGTRISLIHEIEVWAKNENGKPIFWLDGMAGTGKSTIAATVAEIFDRRNESLFASFFFKRGENDRSGTSLFCPTVAKQLANRKPKLAKSVGRAIERDSDIFLKPICDQFQDLILRPLGETSPDGKESSLLILVIDALDECVDETSLLQLLEVLLKLTQCSQWKPKIFLTSRPSPVIVSGFERLVKNYEHVALQDLPPDSIKADISSYLRHELAGIRDSWNRQNWVNESNCTLHSSWPNPKSFDDIVELSVPLFIIAATCCRMIRNSRSGGPDEELRKILQLTKGVHTNDKLGAVYLSVLENSVGFAGGGINDGLVVELRHVLGSIVVLEEPLGVKALATLLDAHMATVRAKLDYLRPVINVPLDPDVPLTLLHPSFRDFLLDPSAKAFHINHQETHHEIGLKCLYLLMNGRTRLHQNMCRLRPGDDRRKIPRQAIDAQIPHAVRYACLHWVNHLSKGQPSLRDQKPVQNFLHSHVLHWLEALSLLGEAPRAIQFVDQIALLFGPSISPELLRFLEDAKMFVLNQISLFTDNPLQLYISALLFSPTGSIIRTTYKRNIPGFVSLYPRTESCWTPLIQTIPCKRLETFDTICVSSDSALIACSMGGTVCIWAVSTAKQLQVITVEGDKGTISLAFSGDSSHIVSAQSDCICIYRIGDGLLVRRIACLEVRCIDASPDSQMIASIHMDTSLMLWPMDQAKSPISLWSDGSKAVQKWEKLLVRFSADSLYVATAIGNSISVWKTSGQHLHKVTLQAGIASLAPFPFAKAMGVRDRVGNIILVDVKEGRHKRIHKLPTSPDHYGMVAFSPDGRHLAYSDRETRKISVVSMASGKHCWSSTEGICERPIAGILLAFSSNGQYLVTADRNCARIWSMATIERSQNPSEDHDEKSDTNETLHCDSNVNAVGCSFGTFPTGNLLISKHSDGRLNIWSSKTGQLIWSLGMRQTPDNVTFSPDGRYVFVSTNQGAQKIWELRGNGRPRLTSFSSPDMEGYSNRLSDYFWREAFKAVFSLDSKRIITASPGYLSVWSIQTAKEDKTFRDWGHMPMAVSPDWKLAACTVEMSHLSPSKEHKNCDKSRKIRLWSIDEGTHFDIADKVGRVHILVISPNREWLGAVSTRMVHETRGIGYDLSIWSATDSSLHRTFVGHTARISSIAFSLDSRQLASASTDKTVRTWSVHHGHCTRIFPVSCSLDIVGFSRDDCSLMTTMGELVLRKPAENSATNDSKFGILNRHKKTQITRKPRWRGYGLNSTGEWITWNGLKVVLLPTHAHVASLNTQLTEERISAVGEFAVAWVAGSGRLFHMSFSQDRTPFAGPRKSEHQFQGYKSRL